MPEIKKRKNSKFYQYDVMVDGVRYRGSCHTDDKSLVGKIASIKTLSDEDINKLTKNLITFVNANKNLTPADSSESKRINKSDNS
ncbi:MAG: hypothetical protein EVG15_01425 [Candidatus Acididesulfobacter diazotrophicus]|jgi:hypothetical protein|uniref:Uncharacterized protein n=1 Tax=Candidatus Acididesulfobacter diazotrophicus TaxID=2597226 RepID=A0A519BQR3_9DELT|nr:MAG: hypothetical protein EVG15_01425 [Candidatus Acididesulfobacter diazotrophicus]